VENAAQPDLKNGVAFRDLTDGEMLLGRVGNDEVILVRRGDAVFAFSAVCTHYQGPLSEGLIVADTVRCPRHHACFSIRTGEALRAPALDPIACWRVERIGDTVFVREKLTATDLRRGKAPIPLPSSPRSGVPRSVVIIGGGAAGLAAADMLRREGYQGPLTMLSADDSPPCDRPNLSKDFLAGSAPDEWLPLRPAEFYAERNIDLRLDCRVTSIDTQQRRVVLGDGKVVEYGALLIATGADPVRLEIPGATPAQLCYLRSVADSRAIVAKLRAATRIVVVGASFIGLEVAAALRERGKEVHVVGPESVPMLRVLGAEVGRFVQSLHEAHGVKFHLGATVQRMDGRKATLSDGTVLNTDFLVLGVGVRPSISLATAAGLAIDRGVIVNEFLETSAPNVFAAGDIARWPDPHSGERIRVEHWVVAQRQGQVAARNVLGRAEKFAAVPFFWSQHYDVTIRYVGHAESWDASEIDGSLVTRDCTIAYKRGRRTLAVASVSRELQSLKAEQTMENAVSEGVS
jgi:NADPH-dependent 2,4-dienoyl-CoA reductase/sulfur reductase-like enzyme/nitrite reductase/ring-hydroxylating ferredoxin subunit